MSTSKRTDAAASPGDAPTRGRRVLGVPSGAIAGAVFFAVTVTGVVYGWRNWGRTVVARPIYRLAVENIEITPPPSWVRTDLRTEVVRDGALNDLTIFDKDATIRVYQAFELHPWVARVKRVSKHPPARLVVDLEYREPVAWMEVPGATPGAEGGVIPVDGLAHVLPSRDFGSQHLGDYLRISIPEPRPYGLAGTAWGDSRVLGATKIAVVLREIWKPLGLYRIQVSAESSASREVEGCVYELETLQRQQIIWGSAPGSEQPREPAASVKVQRLEKMAESGSLDRLPPRGTDLRDTGPLPAEVTRRMQTRR